MSFVQGFPNFTEQVLNPPMFVSGLAQADLATSAYIGMPVGTTILTDAYAGGNGAWIMKASNTAGDYTDWVYLSSGATIGGSL